MEILRNNISTIILLLITFVFGFFTARKCSPETIIEEKTEIVEDTTTVDSLQTELTYWKDIAEEKQDTIKALLNVPAPVEKPDGTLHTQVPYTDKNLSASIGISHKGFIESVAFEYFMKRTLVTETKTEINTVRFIERQTTITKQVPTDSDPYLSISAIGGIIGKDQIAGVGLRYTDSNGFSVGGHYELLHQGVLLDVSLPIRPRKWLFQIF